MKYKELLRKYIDGQLGPEEREGIESEIEKHEAISDYLYEEGGMDIAVQEEEKTGDDTNDEFVKIINHSIRKAFIKLGVVVTAIVLGVVMFCLYGLSPIISEFYYNPGKEMGEFTNQMSLDWAVYSELTMPGLKRDSVSVVDKGYGCYNITINQVWSQNGKFNNVPGEINRGKMVLYDVNTLKQPSVNVFASAAGASIEGAGSEESLTELYGKLPENISSWAAGNKEDATEILNNLEDDEQYIGYVSFEQDLTFEEFMTFLEEIEYAYPAWCGVKISDERYMDGKYGYAMMLSGTSMSGWDESKYPHLVSVGENISENVLKDEAWCKTHFQSLLRYMQDQEKFSKMVNENTYNFDRAINYVEENGMNYYGMAIIAPKELLLRINAHKQVFGIYTQPIS